MYRRSSEYYVPCGMPESFAKLMRHRRYADSIFHHMSVPYYDNILVAETQIDYQRIAMKKAFERMRKDYRQEYNILYEFYFAKSVSVKEYAVICGISFQAMYKKLDRYRLVLRKLSYEELNKLI